jgi:hypothetical protein
MSVLLNSNLSLSDHFPSIIKSCIFHVRDIRGLGAIPGQTAARNIATGLNHSKLDYCNSFLVKLPANQINRLQLVFNSAARAVTNTQKFHHINPMLKSFHWLKKSLNAFTTKFNLLPTNAFFLINLLIYEIF